MKKDRYLPRVPSLVQLVLVFLAIAALAGEFPIQAQTIPADAQPTCTVTQAQFNLWFASSPPQPNGVVNPADSIGFSNNPNCDFYKWSKQMFLWLTSPAPVTYGGGGGRILDSPTFYDVSPPDASSQRTLIPHVQGRLRVFSVRAAQAGPHGLPVVMDKKGRMFEIEKQTVQPGKPPLVRNTAGKLVPLERVEVAPSGKLMLFSKAGKEIKAAAPPPRKAINTPLLRQRTNPLLARLFNVGNIPVLIDPAGNIIETEEGQADAEHSALLAQNGSLIYYVIIVNDVYAYFMTAMRDGAIPATAPFPTSAADLAPITAFASAHGKTFPDPKALAIEVKSAWIETTGIPNPNDYITMQATIPTYDKMTNPNHWVVTGQKEATLALVAMHVVGSANGHPEMIWSTFEHFGNTPNATYTYNSTSSGVKTVTQDTSGSWLFCATGASGSFNVPRAKAQGADIVNATGQTVGPSNILRMKPWGGAVNASPNPVDAPSIPLATAASTASNTEIISINNSVSHLMPAPDVRNNYFMTGSTWTINGFGFNGNFGNPGNNAIVNGRGVGTSQIANTTMETFQQTNSLFDNFSNNCFSCHESNTTNVSHVFGALKKLF